MHFNDPAFLFRKDREDGVVPLLWTAGWDSTFRLMDLIHIEKRPVRPIYIIPNRRQSLWNEIKSMSRIKNLIEHRFPNDASRLRETFYYSQHNIAVDLKLSGYYFMLDRRKRIGFQYQWFGNFAKQFDIQELEMGVTKEFQKYLDGQFERYSPAPGWRDTWRLKTRNRLEGLELFRRFRFPLLDLTKVDMRLIARERGFENVLLETWFCHFPRKKIACGKCPPCRDALAQGMEWRVPQLTRWRLKARPRIKKLKKMLALQ